MKRGNPPDSGMTNAKGNGVGVTVRDGRLETALKIFKKRIKNERILILYKESLYYTKPSEKRRKDKLIRKLRSNRREY